jgi:hypothetical protein
MALPNFNSIRSKIAAAFQERDRTIAEIDARCEQLLELHAEREGDTPTLDETAEYFDRNIDAWTKEIDRRARFYINSKNLSAFGAEWMSAEKWPLGFALFQLGVRPYPPSHQTMQCAHEPTLISSEPMSAAVLVWLLGPQLKAALRERLKELLPETANGIPKEQRRAKLREIDAELERLAQEREALLDASKGIELK